MKIDKIKGVAEECTFEYRGYPCVILFMDMGHRCGYVGIPEKDISKIDTDEIDAYGGITYGPFSHLHFQEDIGVEWIGFNTAHYGDRRDVESVRKYFGDERANRVSLFDLNEFGTIKPLEFCKQKCMNIVNQVIEMMEE